MRSVRGLIGAVTILLSYPVALGAQALFAGGAVTVIHVGTGAGFVIFATAIADFALPRWINLLGAVAAGMFGGIFLLQGLADVTQAEALRYVAFDVLGRHVERLLPYGVYLWCTGWLLLGSRGKSRILGWIVMIIVVLTEVLSLASVLFAFSMPNLKVVILLPFVWLLVESVEPRSAAPLREPELAWRQRSGS